MLWRKQLPEHCRAVRLVLLHAHTHTKALGKPLALSLAAQRGLFRPRACSVDVPGLARLLGLSITSRWPSVITRWMLYFAVGLSVDVSDAADVV